MIIIYHVIIIRINFKYKNKFSVSTKLITTYSMCIFIALLTFLFLSQAIIKNFHLHVMY